MGSVSRSKTNVPVSVQRLVDEAADSHAGKVQRVTFDEGQSTMARPAHWPDDAILGPGEYCTGRYLLTDFLGRGGIAEVYEARDMLEESFVALKVVRTEKERVDVLEKVAAEARTLKLVKHRNVLRVFDAGFVAEDHLLFFAMERLLGSTLHDLIYRSDGARAVPRRPALSLLQAVRIAGGVARGVSALHAHKIIHRDIKPENLFFTADGVVKVFDLDIAKFNNSCRLRTTRRGYTMGTVLYMSPEHLHEGRTDERSDIYAIGFVLYELVAGHHAFATSPDQVLSHTDVIPWHTARMPPQLASLIEGVPIALDAIVRKCTQKDPGLRYSSCEELAVALAKLEVLLLQAERRGQGNEESAGGDRDGAGAAEKEAWGADDGAATRRSFAKVEKKERTFWPGRETGVPAIVVDVHGALLSPKLPVATTERTSTAVPSTPIALLPEPLFDQPEAVWQPPQAGAADLRAGAARAGVHAVDRTAEVGCTVAEEQRVSAGNRAPSEGPESGAASSKEVLRAAPAVSAAVSGVRPVTAAGESAAESGCEARSAARDRATAAPESAEPSGGPRTPAALRAFGPTGTQMIAVVPRRETGTTEMATGAASIEPLPPPWRTGQPRKGTGTEALPLAGAPGERASESADGPGAARADAGDGPAIEGAAIELAATAVESRRAAATGGAASTGSPKTEPLFVAAARPASEAATTAAGAKSAQKAGGLARGPDSRGRRPSQGLAFAVVFVAGIAVASLGWSWLRRSGADGGAPQTPASPSAATSPAAAASDAPPEPASPASASASGTPPGAASAQAPATSVSTSPKPAWKPRPAPKPIAAPTATPAPVPSWRKRLPTNPRPRTP